MAEWWNLLKKQKDPDLTLPRGKEVVLQAEDKDYERGLLVKLLKNGGYEMAYWYDKHKPYPIEVLVDGKSIKKDAKKVTMKFHPQLKKAMENTEQVILNEIEKEGGALGMKNLKKVVPDEKELKSTLDNMIRQGKVFVHKDGDIYTHEPKSQMEKGCGCSHCVGSFAAMDFLEKKLCPAGKAAAKRKFKVYPSAYANGWAVQYCKGKFRGKKKTKVKKSLPSRFGRYAQTDESGGEEDFRERIGTDIDRNVKPDSMKTIRDKYGDPYAGMSEEEASNLNRKSAMSKFMNHPVNQNIPDSEMPLGHTLETMPQDMLERFYRERYLEATERERMAEKEKEIAEKEPTEMEDIYSQAFSQVQRNFGE